MSEVSARLTCSCSCIGYGTLLAAMSYVNTMEERRVFDALMKDLDRRISIAPMMEGR